MFGPGTKGKRVLSAMSGGVDSSVATMLLFEDEYDVLGVTMRLFDGNLLGDDTGSACSSLDDVEDAKETCRRLGTEHETLDFRDRFSSCVIDKFCDAYLSGRTPNPCIDCNRHLKFAGLQQRRRSLDADYVATGHYVRRRFNEDSGKWELLRAADPAKDQSYVLYNLTQDDLEHMLFPLGELAKEEVRDLAKTYGFSNAEKAESQDICFVPDGDHVAFIKRYVGEDSVRNLDSHGAIVDADGKQLGVHAGLVNYTIGQRKGIGIASSEPLYVIDKDVSSGQLTVGFHDKLLINRIEVADVNIISGDYSPRTMEVEVKTSYRQTPVPATIEILSDRTAGNLASDECDVKTTTCAIINFHEPIIKPAPGQAAVFYQGDTVIGGGTIC